MIVKKVKALDDSQEGIMLATDRVCNGSFQPACKIGDISQRLELSNCELKFLRMRLGCTICDARSKIDGATALENRFGSLHDLALRVRHQEQRRRGPKGVPLLRRGHQGSNQPGTLLVTG